MVVIKQQTMPGADVFIRGGVSPADTIDITHYDWPGELEPPTPLTSPRR